MTTQIRCDINVPSLFGSLRPIPIMCDEGPDFVFQGPDVARGNNRLSGGDDLVVDSSWRSRL
jgi:hypothetical protein